MFVHSVFFWLKDELTQDQKEQFRQGVETLITIQPSVAVYVGTVADTDRPIIDKSYDLALTCIFENKADQDEYQIDPVHLAFVDNHKEDWKKVLIYDAD